jgi:putative MATE family efflux protein
METNEPLASPDPQDKAPAARRPLLRTDVLSDILRLSWPAILEQVLLMMGGMVVAMFLGKYGTAELAAAGLVNMVMVVLQTAFAGLATGATVIVARIVGEGDDRTARSALFQALVMALGISVVVVALTYFFADPILSVFFGSESADAAALAPPYFRILLYSLPFLVVDMTIAASMRGAGDTKTPMLVSGIGAVLNVGLCFLLIGPMGIVGAGLALSASRVVTSLLRVALMFGYRRVLYLMPRERYRIDRPLMGRIFRQGLPAFLEQTVMQGGFLMMSGLLTGLGTAQYASWQVGVQMNSLAFMPIFGLAVATTTYVGQALGAGRLDDASDGVRESVRLAIVSITLIGILAAIFANPLARLFSNDPEVIRSGVMLIRFFAVLEPLLAIMNVCAGTLRAGGDIPYVMWTAFVGLWVFRVGVSFVMIRFVGLGLEGVMVGTALDFIARAALYGNRVRQGHWKHRKV